MLPLFDENPVRRRAWATWILVLINVATFAGGGLADDGTPTEIPVGADTTPLPAAVDHNLRWAAVPCEVIQGRPLTAGEVAATVFGGDPQACDPSDTGPAVHPGKRVLLSVVSSLFLHDGAFHLVVNMLFLWVFGNNVEDRLGHVPFLLFYVAAGIVGTGAYLAAQPSGTVAILGASGAVAGVMGSYLIWYPDAPIRTLVFLVLVDIRARWFLGGWFAIQFFTWTGPGAWIAHVAGFAFGVVAGRLVRRYQPRLRLGTAPVPAMWDRTGGAGHGPYPHLDEVWNEPHHEYYERRGD